MAYQASVRRPLQTVVETPRFIRHSEHVGLRAEERMTIVNAIAADPAQGDEVQGSGDVRKARFAGRGNFDAVEIATMRQATSVIKQAWRGGDEQAGIRCNMEGLGDALDHARGNDVRGLVVHVPTHIDVPAVRRRTGLSQHAFAGRIGVSVGTLRNWEQGRWSPDDPARVLLAMIARNPRVVEDTSRPSPAPAA